ncbi:unnamed protein product, partial [Prorocentrum cordatum]
RAQTWPGLRVPNNPRRRHVVLFGCPPRGHQVLYLDLARLQGDKSYGEIHSQFQNWYGNTFHRNLGRYFYAHRCGAMGAFAPLVTFMVGFKIATMYYGTQRDVKAATLAAEAYGQGGYKTNPGRDNAPQTEGGTPPIPDDAGFPSIWESIQEHTSIQRALQLYVDAPPVGVLVMRAVGFNAPDNLAWFLRQQEDDRLDEAAADGLFQDTEESAPEWKDVMLGRGNLESCVAVLAGGAAGGDPEERRQQSLATPHSGVDFRPLYSCGASELRGARVQRSCLEALLWRQQDAERQTLEEGIETLFRQRKATLRYLRRCEDAGALLALQCALTPRPQQLLPPQRAAGAARVVAALLRRSSHHWYLTSQARPPPAAAAAAPPRGSGLGGGCARRGPAAARASDSRGRRGARRGPRL